jgi:GntR family transcriptional regulator, transcriptional repressor for pyruvate dehydrogenase complex
MVELVRGRPRRYADDLDYNILKILGERKAPVGSGTLQIELRRRGFRLSAPTVGRKLRELEVEGLLAKIGVQGRTLTNAGRAHLVDLGRRVMLQSSSDALHYLVASGGKDEILDLLEARRIIEREIIRLAVQRAGDRDLQRLEQILHKQERQVARGELGVAEDVEFHDALAEIGGNKVLRSLLAVLRQQGQYTYVITFIRTRVGGRLAVDHVEILEAMRGRELARAQRAVDDHLRKLMRDVERYWRQAVRSTGRERRAAWQRKP